MVGRGRNFTKGASSEEGGTSRKRDSVKYFEKAGAISVVLSSRLASISAGSDPLPLHVAVAVHDDETDLLVARASFVLIAPDDSRPQVPAGRRWGILEAIPPGPKSRPPAGVGDTMSHRMRRLLLGATLAIAVLPLVAGDGTVDLEGGFVWEREGETHEGALKAVLTPTGEGAWDVAFHFDWEDGPHVYKGTCRGSLDGELAGDVTADGDREMNFKFRGSFKDGRFAGTHAFVTSDGEEQSSGTLTLAAPGKG